MPTWAVSARCLTTPENRAAMLALNDVYAALTSGAADALPTPLFLHGPSGTGKTMLVQALANELRKHGIESCELSANDLAESSEILETLHADLLIVQDLQHLPARFANVILHWLDHRTQHGLPTIFTATMGPGKLKPRGVALPSRLTSRLASGLVVALEPMQALSRRKLLKRLAEDAKLTVATDVLDWLAEHLTGGGRQLHGAIRQIQSLQRLQAKRLTIDDLQAHFRTQIDAGKPTVKRIAEHVSEFYRVKPKQMMSAQRSREVVLPRQVSMYLARQLTDLSFEKIGKFFGGRDHKTVQHACKKVDSMMKSNAELCGAVNRMHAELA